MTQVGDATLESTLGGWLAKWARASARHRGRVALGALVVFAASLFLTATRLGVRSETEALFPGDLPFRVRDARFLEAFPMLHETIVLVVEGPSAEATRTATLRLAERLRAEPALYPRVDLPADPFFERNGLLYLSLDDLDALASRLARLQPLLAGLARDESLRGLMDQTRLAVEALRRDRLGEVEIAPVLGRIEATLDATLGPGDDDGDGSNGTGHIDWSALVDWGDPRGDPRRRVIHVQPALDYGSMAAAREAILRLRAVARELGLTDARGFRVRMTGDMVLNFDEMTLLQTQVAWAGVGSFVVVAGLLFLALRSARLVAATVLSLVFGLCVTAGFATLAIGHLNMISVAFAVLFIGLGVDFGIHLCMRYQELRAAGRPAADALEASAGGVGTSLMLCAVTTAVGFFAFVPTDFVGVAELGVIAGVGMLIGVASSFTVIPALLAGDERRAPPRVTPLRLPTAPERSAGWVAGGALVLALGGLALLPSLRFDQNPLDVRDPNAESVRVYRDLLADSDRSPWTLEYLAADAAEARGMAARFAALSEVDATRTFADYLPDRQREKLELVIEIAFLIDWDAVRGDVPPATPEASRAALEALAAELGRARRAPLPDDVATAVARLESALVGWLGRLEGAPEAVVHARLADLERRLLGNFRDLLLRLERSLEAEAFGPGDLPGSVREARIAPDGRHRVEILPAEDLARPGALDRFVAAGRSVTEELAGPAIRIHASARAVVGALVQALSAAIVVIVCFLALLWRRAGDVALVTGPLLFAGLMTGASMVLADIPFNFADVIVLPLLLGIGVDSGIHMVHRARLGEDADVPLLGTSTARAVVFSALTTIASFGTLALVPHRGMASLGQLLVIGVAWTVAANLVLLPALLALRARRAAPVARTN